MKTIEEKIEDYIKENSMNRMYMTDYVKAGYDIAKKEIIYELERRIVELSKFIEHPNNKVVVINYKLLLEWITEKGTDD